MENIKQSTFHHSGTQSMAWFLLILFVFEICMPSYSLAGGPTQPEASTFTPVGISDMVDPFTGDFTYNIPLMDVEGYPLNIAYNAGISMDQEASWVGLGWNLNVGSVVRNMRGLPDDFNGDLIVKETSMKPTRNYSLKGAFSTEIFGKKLPEGNSGDGVDPPSFNASMEINYNNYNGWGAGFSFGPSHSFSLSDGHSLTAGFSLSGSSENGASFAPSASFGKKIDKGDQIDRKLSFNVGSAFNSRAGLSYLSYGLNASWDNDNTGAARKASFSKGLNSSFDLGLASYSPSASNSMRSVAINGSWKFGADFFGVDGTLALTLGYSSQWIAEEDKLISSPAFGFFNLQNGQSKRKALLDFNRDNDGSYTETTPNLPSAHLTPDLFSVQAQGISGSYRGYRNDIGYVFDPEIKTISTSGGVGIETGLGGIAKLGVDVNVNIMSSVTGGWDNSFNKAKNTFRYENASTPLEAFALIEANEKSVDTDLLFKNQLIGSHAVAFQLSGNPKVATLENNLEQNGAILKTSPTNNRLNRYKRNQLMQILSHQDLKNHFGVDTLNPQTYVGALDHHIGEIIQTGTDGRRYVFGIAAYNHFQEDVTFAVGKKINGEFGLPVTNDFDGLVNYGASTNAVTRNNPFGLDNYYSSSTTPAYAHSFMLTSVLSDDYIDIDTIQGPSKNDYGSYVKFNYDKVDNYEWRSPVAAYDAFRNDGMKTDPTDDKASFIYGKKDLWYVKAVETKNYVAIFTLEERRDAKEVHGRNGGINPSGQSMKLLRKISLYSRPDYEANIGDLSQATPIQEVHFRYSYELCEGYPNNLPSFVPTEDEDGLGKLTLKEIFFTYQHSNRMKRSSYKFEYNGENPTYNLRAVDRWGNYKPVLGSGTENPIMTQLNNADYPYVDQNDSDIDKWVAAWSLTDIYLPSGGKIHVDYESDDYAFVQSEKAMRMFNIVATDFDLDPGVDNFGDFKVHSVSGVSPNENRKIYFKLDDEYEDVSTYVKAKEIIYFRCLVDFMNALDDDNKNKYDYVSGYGKVKSVDKVIIGGQSLGCIEFEGENLKDNGVAKYSPIAKSAIQFGRLHLSRYISDAQQNDPSNDASEQGLLDFAQSAYNAAASLKELFTGPNLAIYEQNRGRNIVTNKSWIRLNDPRAKKKGGGLRVKQVLMYDEWSSMTSGNMESFYYGQQYEYTLENGESSGVASYEPQVGGDENPWRQPEMYNNKIRLSPDQNLYQESPIAESLFPSPSVGYSRVVIKNITHSGVKRTATGKVVKEFYTAKDFPTIVNKTNIDPLTKNSFLPLLPKYQYMSASQGFSIELNDMHGKEKKEAVYGENMNVAISEVEYFYQMQSLNAAENTNKLKNTVQVVNTDGTLGVSEIGVRHEATSDFRKSTTKSQGGALGFNANALFIVIGAFVVPTIWPSIDKSTNEFKSATLTKVTNRFGILYKTVAKQDGSRVETNNLAYDAQTGEVLATQTTTNFNDNVYSMNYPGYWKYDQLGQAYKNIGVSFSGVNFNNSGFAAIPNAPQYFVAGDELMLKNDVNDFYSKAWVKSVNPNGINIIDKVGNAIEVSSVILQVIRSGRRNKQMTSMASLTSLTNPLSSLVNNSYKNVLNAGAIEYAQDWKTYCQCLNNETVDITTNPYILGTLGNLRPVKSYTHLSDRTQSNYDNNTNIRRDGMFTSYSPFYRMENGKWNIKRDNWTFVSEVTQFSPNGMTLETKDALGRSSASLFGFNNTLTTAVASNTSLKQLEFASFEDNAYSSCSGQQFLNGGENVVNTESHTGRNSIRVESGSPLVFEVAYLSCEKKCTMYLQNVEFNYQVVNGTAPYTMDLDVISGDVDVAMTPSGQLMMLGHIDGGFEIRIQITDANGCQISEHFSRDAY